MVEEVSILTLFALEFIPCKIVNVSNNCLSRVISPQYHGLTFFASFILNKLLEFFLFCFGLLTALFNGPP